MQNRALEKLYLRNYIEILKDKDIELDKKNHKSHNCGEKKVLRNYSAVNR